jgi:hypothetical protein
MVFSSMGLGRRLTTVCSDFTKNAELHAYDKRKLAEIFLLADDPDAALTAFDSLLSAIVVNSLTEVTQASTLRQANRRLT